jgi:uncharacterized surface protein with fasciclin (FAS1) repeats
MIQRPNLIETIAKHSSFSKFSQMLDSCGANDLLNADSEFTVFVPTDEAFSKISASQMENLMNESGLVSLRRFVSYHIVPGRLMAPNFRGHKTRVTATGDEVKFSDVGFLKVNESNIQARNIDAANGLIHAIDSVLWPPMRSVATSSIL